MFGLVFASALLFGSPSVDQTVQRSAVHGVRLTVSVQDQGRPVIGLGPEDFELFDEGVRQVVDSATAPGRVALAIVLDTSLSVRVPGFERVLAIADRLVQTLPSEDSAAVVGFSNRATILAPLTRDKQLLATGIRTAETLASGLLPRSVVWDSVVGAASLLRDDSAIPVVLLFSDGMDNASWLTRDQAASVLNRLGVVLDFIATPWNNGSYDFFPPGRNAPEELARATGGTTFRLAAKDLDLRLSARLEEARHSYVLTFSPRGVRLGDGWHDLTVKLRVKSAVVRARRGYQSTAPPTRGRAR